MEYKELYKLHFDFEKRLNTYVLQKDEVDDKYYTAKVFIKDLFEKSYKNKAICESYGTWLKTGGTINLMKLLKNTEYNDSDIIHFNAMCLIDTVNACF